MGGAISAVTRVFDAPCASPFATRMGDAHHVATCTRTAVDRYRPDDLARAPGEQTRTLKIEHAASRKRHDQTHRLRRKACAQAKREAASSAAAPAARCRKFRRGSFMAVYVCSPPGRRTANTEPLPGSLVTVTSPPIMRASLREMPRPRPVPP